MKNGFSARFAPSGRNATLDRAFPSGWHHVAAVREARRLRLFVDGAPVAESAEFAKEDYNLTNRQPLRIGTGAQDYFEGSLTDVRLHRVALSDDQIKSLAQLPASKDP